MPKNKHHFVPRFYLAGFQSAPKRINVLGVDSAREVEHASLRDQCYRHKFYGQGDAIEDALSVMEGQASEVLKNIKSTGMLPKQGSGEYTTLLVFVVFQLLRTTTAVDRVNALLDKAMKQAHSRDPRLQNEDLEAVRLEFNDPAVFALATVPQMLIAFADLDAHLIVSPRAAFITSDNPAFKYNQYCEGINDRGIAGPLCRGFQMFLPLTPNFCLMLYDRDVYSVPRPDRRNRRSSASESDVDSLNGLQLVSARKNIYFSDWDRRQALHSLLARVRQRRDRDPTVVEEYGLIPILTTRYLSRLSEHPAWTCNCPS